MPAFLQNLDQSVRRALALAGQRHEYASPEHLLLALTDDPDAAPVMQACNVDLEKLRGALLASMPAPDGSPFGTVPTTSQSFQADLQRATVHAQSVGREEITGANVLVTILAGPAAGFLHEQGMTRYDATSFISHGITKDAQMRRRDREPAGRSGPQALSSDSAGASMFRVRLLNDDYTPMEFVVCILEEVFGLERETAMHIMLQTHQEGMGECGPFSREEAEARAAQVMDLARQNQHPLRCSLELVGSV